MDKLVAERGAGGQTHAQDAAPPNFGGVQPTNLPLIARQMLGLKPVVSEGACFKGRVGSIPCSSWSLS